MSKVMLRIIIIVSLTVNCTACTFKKEVSNGTDIETENKNPISETPEKSNTNENVPNEKLNVEFDYIKDSWELINLENCRFKTKDEFEEEVVEYINEIAEITLNSKWYKKNEKNITTCIVLFDFKDNVISNTKLPIIYSKTKILVKITLNRRLFECDFSPIAHELTHALCNTDATDSISLSEGLAGYMQDNIGNNPFPMSFGINIHNLIKTYMEDGYYTDDIIKNIGCSSKIYPYMGGSNIEFLNRSLWYNASQSFVTYLIDTYGMEDFMNVYNADNVENAYEKIMGKDIISLRQEWLVFLDNYSCKMTKEEIEKYINELYKEHGYNVVE